jgi:hypothetical protein
MSISKSIRKYIKENNVRKASEIYSQYEQMLEENFSSMNRESFYRLCRRIFSEVTKNRKEVEREKESEAEIEFGLKSKKEISSTGEIETTALLPENFKTVEQVAKYCDIDLKKYYADEIISNRWNTSSKYVCWQFKVKWKLIYKKDEISPQDALNIFKDTIKDEDLKTPSIQIEEPNKDSRIVLEIQIPDLHLGQLSWGEETGNPNFGNYDIKISKKEFLKAVSEFYRRYKDREIKKIIFPLGNDFFNVNNSMGSTSNGTFQDEDDRSKKTFRYGLQTIIESISILSQLAPIEIISIPGNHDEEKIFYLTTALEIFYKDVDSITVDSNPSDRKYRKIGKTLLGLAHGKTKGRLIKMDEFPTIMADEAPELWASCPFREFHIGHIHHNKIINKTLADEFRGTIIRAVPSLSQIDQWHHSSGYRATRQAHCYEYDEEKGLINISIYNA